MAPVGASPADKCPLPVVRKPLQGDNNQGVGGGHEAIIVRWRSGAHYVEEGQRNME